MNRYLEIVDNDSDIRDHLPTFVRLVKELDAQTVIELGVRDGNSSAAWLHGLEQTGGHLWAVDVSGMPDHLAGHPQITFVQGDDRWDVVLDALPDVADIVFVDTSHEYQHTCDEIRLYSGRVRPGGCMVFHDTAVENFGTENDPPFPVRKAVEEWVREDGLTAQWDDACYGLAIVWVPNA